MNAQQLVRLLIPAGLFLVLVASPRSSTTGAVDGPTPLVSPEDQPAPDVPLTELYHELTAKNAQVTVVEFSDFGCPYCGRFENEAFPELRKEFVETGKVTWRFVPFVLGMFPNGSEAMRAATCVAEQSEDGFWKMHDLLFARQDEWKNERRPDKLFHNYAVTSGADGTTFDACYESARAADREAAANALANRSGVHSTPTFFVNGKMIQGALPLEQFQAMLREITH